MSLLLDALKKAAEDKKNKAGEKPDATTAEADLDLDLDMDEADDFPAVDKNLANKTVAEKNTSEPLQAKAEVTGSDLPNAEPAEPVIQSPVTEEAQPEVTETHAPPTEPPAAHGSVSDNNVAEQAEPEPEPELEMSIDQIIEKDRSQQDKEVLTYLIHKSNQLSDQKRRQKRIIYGVLAGVILLVLGIFSYLKLLVVSEQLYTGKPVEKTETRRQPGSEVEPPVQNTPAASKDPVSVKPTEPVAPAITKASQSKTPAVQQPKAVKAARPSPSPAIKIVHKKVVDPTDTYLQDAYRLFNTGQYDQARLLYQRVLQNEPKNRDALLGVAAVDMKQENYEAARQKYLYLLKLNPKDSIARAGISAMPSQADAALNESQLKLMLREQPEAAHLYFALGNLYASASRWGEAQSAFFSAWSADSENADYAFNLAVSLDHLGKYKQALEFYRKSLLLNSSSSSNISPDAINMRIDFLQAQHE